MLVEIVCNQFTLLSSKEERFAMEIAQSQLELNTLRDNGKLP